MAWRKQQQRRTSDEQAAQTFEWTPSQPQELDDILDEIDGVLEVNAEEYVRSFVQKGGE